MIKHFYSYTIETDNLKIELDKLELATEEKEHLLRLVESTIHNAIIDLVLSELPEEDRKLFLHYLHTKHQEKIWKLLHSKIKDIEDKIRKTAKDLEKEFIKDIQEVK